ncbi:MAG: helix-turn-helix domain-containing protein [Clostridia bacterium]
MELNERLFVLRKTNGMTQEAMAQALFVSRQTIYKWETGKAQPDLNKFAEICELFHVSADSLLCDSFPVALQESKEEAAADETMDKRPLTQAVLAPQPLSLAAESDEVAVVTDRKPHACIRKKPLTAFLCSGGLLAMIASALFILLGMQDKEMKAAQRLGIIPAAVQVNAASIAERDFLHMLLVASTLQHSGTIQPLANAEEHATKQRLTREKAAYWIYCTHVWTMLDAQADMSVGRNGSVDPISQRNVYEELNSNSRVQIPTEKPWDAVLCEELREANHLFESYDGTAEMDTQILSIMEGAYYTAVTFCVAQRSYESNQPILELTNGSFRTKALITATEAIHAVYRLYNAW